METDRDENDERQSHTSPVEWAVAALGALLVLGAAGSLLYEALAGPATPPAVAVEVRAIQPVGSGYLVEFEAFNHGGETAAQVTVEGTLSHDGSEVEASTTMLDFIPPEAHRRGGLFFTEDPRAFELALRATGYASP